ncbi:MAG: sigma-70 family RNA polymerase sigma factor [Ruminococcus flavefaciens]|nr:sigma-70 family RNA polymerase sigma factor [Ruminococcus flavefaciens]
MSKVAECQQLLFNEATKKGFLTFDDIMNISDTYSLSVSEVDQLSEALQLHGIIIYEIAPLEKGTDHLEDYSRIDYDAVFKEVVSLSDELEYIVELIKKLPPPQYGEISALTAQIAEGNAYARERLILIHLRNVLKIALSMAKAHQYDLVDAVSAGFIGLIFAVDRFDPNGFSAFQSYASLWIQQNINRECNPVWIEYYFPAHYKEKMLPIYERYLSHSCENCQPNHICDRMISEISKQMDITAEQAEEYLNMALQQVERHICLDEINEESLSEIADELVQADDTLFECVTALMTRTALSDALSSLKSKEADILRLRIGFDDGCPLTLEEVGAIYGVTRERIRQIEAKALRKLGHPSRAKKLKDFWS